MVITGAALALNVAVDDRDGAVVVVEPYCWKVYSGSAGCRSHDNRDTSVRGGGPSFLKS